MFGAKLPEEVLSEDAPSTEVDGFEETPETFSVKDIMAKIPLGVFCQAAGLDTSGISEDNPEALDVLLSEVCSTFSFLFVYFNSPTISLSCGRKPPNSWPPRLGVGNCTF